MPEPKEQLNPHPGRLTVEHRVSLAPREGMDRTLYFYSYSGALVVEGPLPILDGVIDGMRFEILPPTRIGEPALRPTPQFTRRSISKFLELPDPLPFPIQVAAFAAPNDENGARISVWNGPGDDLAPHAPEPPCDTILVVLHGPDSGSHGEIFEKYFLEPLLEWVRVLSDQWWAGRSYEGISGALHFIAPVDRDGRTVGTPTPVARMATGGPHMRPIDATIWTEAADKAGAGQVPGYLALATDAKFMLTSKEFRAGCVLACGAFESARDEVLEKAKLNLSALKCSETNLLQHLSVGFDAAFGRNLEKEQPETFSLLKAFWIARGHAAHGKTLQWREGEQVSAIDEIKSSVLTDGIDRVLAWIRSIRITFD